MELEQQVCSLELAKKLKELGVKQESFAYWFSQTYAVEPVLIYGEGAERVFANWNGKKPPTSNGGLNSAFTVAELGEMLPPYGVTRKCPMGDWHCGDSELGIKADTEADARAKLLIYLLENKLLTHEA